MTHPSARLTLDPAKAADIDWLVGAVTALAREDGHAVAPDIAALLAGLIGDEHLGTAFVLRADGTAIGYAILCHGYSLEYGGRDTILDEIYIAPEHRGSGAGTAAMAALERWAVAQGFKAMHLEVMTGNRAERLYRRQG